MLKREKPATHLIRLILITEDLLFRTMTITLNCDASLTSEEYICAALQVAVICSGKFSQRLFPNLKNVEEVFPLSYRAVEVSFPGL